MKSSEHHPVCFAAGPAGAADAAADQQRQQTPAPDGTAATGQADEGGATPYKDATEGDQVCLLVIELVCESS